VASKYRITFENYMAVKKRADVHLTGTDLEWVIQRPGTLTDDRGTGQVRVGPAIPYGKVSREDVASVLVSIVEQPRLVRIIFELTEGNQPVRQAIKGLVNRYADCP
jgi:uncharacterized protein YbjT (DUF2867 family)